MIGSCTIARWLIGWLVAFKIVYCIALAMALIQWPTVEDGVNGSFRQKSSSEGRVSFESHFVSWDARSYLFLSNEGYKHGSRECAFYPLYPLLIRCVSIIFRGHAVLIGMILANLFSLLAWLLFFKIAVQHVSESAATFALVLLLSFPGSLFFQFIYTESLFLLLLMLLVHGLEDHEFWIAFVSAFLLPLTRAVGILCLFPLIWHLFFRSPPPWWKSLIVERGRWGAIARVLRPRNADSPGLNVPVRDGVNAVCLVLAPLMGWATYFLLIWKWTGNAFEGIEAQRYYGVQSIENLFEPVKFVTKLFNPTEWHAFTGSVLDRCVFILLINCLPFIWRLDKSWCIWAFFLGVVPAISGGLTSFTRFASVVFPLFIALGVLLNKPEMRWWRWLVLTIFVILHVTLVWRFVNFRWAG